jgi:hypothetical protein
MGNALSEEEENELLEEAYSMSLESPEADGYLNAGTAAPNCQPKHTKDADDIQNKNKSESHGGEKHRISESEQVERRKRQHTNSQNAEGRQAQEQRKPSYLQMARMGYQELVNAIIRPPRADYKVGVLGFNSSSKNSSEKKEF